jgi:hypothetical protein
LQIADNRICVKLPPDMILVLFFGYIVMNGTVPDEIGKSVDDIEEKDIPAGWKMVVAMWKKQGRRSGCLYSHLALAKGSIVVTIATTVI